VAFIKTDYIRVGSYTKKLGEYPALQAQLWDRLRNTRFEELYSCTDLELSEALSLLQVSAYFDFTGLRQPENIKEAAHYLIQENILVKQDNGRYAITNLGAVLFAKKLSSFPRISRKAMRIVQYEGSNRMNMIREYIHESGYAVDFEEILRYISALLPSRELIQEGLRRKITAYPDIAIREAVANALIHQDFSAVGTGPVTEIFDDRIEITNAGIPLVDISCIIDNPPRSRNEKLAELMRRLHICEELGTGWDKMVISCEYMQLPAPKIAIYADSTRVTLFSSMRYADMPMSDRVWSCYLHACIKYIQGEQMTNQSLRERFGMKKSSSGTASRLIKETINRKLIKPLDPDTAPRYMKYIPVWA
jgi:ATP-dependent DNA helicase RecG